jgi:excisionase family DNA binding protein
VSDKLSVPLRTVYQWIYHGKLPAYKISVLWRIKKTDFEAFVAADNQATK